jgi:hypothetical protein
MIMFSKTRLSSDFPLSGNRSKDVFSVTFVGSSEALHRPGFRGIQGEAGER